MSEAATTTETVETTTETVENTAVNDKAESAKSVETTETPEQIKAALASAQARIHELNKENERRRKAQEALEQQQKADAEAQLAEQGKFKELADTRTAERDAAKAELDTAAQKLARYDTLLSADIDARIKPWPDEVKKLIPSGEGVDALAKLERITELEPLATRLMKAAAPGGNGAGPVANGLAPADAKEAATAQRNITRRALG